MEIIANLLEQNFNRKFARENFWFASHSSLLEQPLIESQANSRVLVESQVSLLKHSSSAQTSPWSCGLSGLHHIHTIFATLTSILENMPWTCDPCNCLSDLSLPFYCYEECLTLMNNGKCYLTKLFSPYPVQDDDDNITRFLILAREPIIPGTDRPYKV